MLFGVCDVVKRVIKHCYFVSDINMATLSVLTVIVFDAAVET